MTSTLTQETSKREMLPLSQTPYTTWMRAAGIAAQLRTEIDKDDQALYGPLVISPAWRIMNHVVDYCTAQANSAMRGEQL